MVFFGAVAGGGSGDGGRLAEAVFLPGQAAADRPGEDAGQLGAQGGGQVAVFVTFEGLLEGDQA